MIEDLFKEYLELTNIMIVDLKKDKNIQPLMDKRGIIFEEIKKDPMNLDTKKEFYISMDIEKVNRELGELLKVKFEEYRTNIHENENRKRAYSAYMNNGKSGSFFAKKV